MEKKQEIKEELEYQKYKVNDRVNVYKNNKFWFCGLISKILTSGLILNDVAGAQPNGAGFNGDILAGSYLPFQTNPDVVTYRFSIVK